MQWSNFFSSRPRCDGAVHVAGAVGQAPASGAMRRARPGRFALGARISSPALEQLTKALGGFETGLDAAEHLWLVLALVVGFCGVCGFLVAGFFNVAALLRLLPGRAAFAVR